MATATKLATGRRISASVIKGGKLKAEILIPDTLSVLDDPRVKPGAGCGCLRILTPEDGDKRVVWDANRSDEIRDAKRLFNQLVEQGLVPYEVGADGKASPRVMSEFDATAEEIIFLPVALVAGG